MRKGNKLFGFLIVIIFIISILLFYNYSYKNTDSENLIIKGGETPSRLLEIRREGLYPNSYIKAFVLKVVDGDTITVIYKKSKYKIRLLDVDTPESVKPGVPVQVYSKEATQFTQKKLLNQEVKLVFEKSLKDRYGRLLAHVILKNEDYFNGILVRMGYARVEVLKPNNTYEEYFKKQQELAINDKQGVWGLKISKNPFVKNKYGNYIPRN